MDNFQKALFFNNIEIIINLREAYKTRKKRKARSKNFLIRKKKDILVFEKNLK